MPTIDERLASVEAKVDGINDLRAEMRGFRDEMRAEMREFRAEMRGLRTELRDDISGVRGEVGALRDAIGGVRVDVGALRGETGGVRAEMNLRFNSHDLRFDALDQKVDRHFSWLATSQAAMVAAFVGWLVMAWSR